MVDLRSRCGHYILQMWLVSFFLWPPYGIGRPLYFRPVVSFSFFFPRLLAALLDQRPSLKLCGVVQRIELRNFGRGRHLYSAGRPSCWASAHILLFLSLAPNIASLDRYGRVWRWTTLADAISGFAETGSSFSTAKRWQIRPYIVLKSNWKSGTASSFMSFRPYCYFR